MTPIVYSPEALDDLQEVLTFLGDQDPKLAEKFEADYRKALRIYKNHRRALDLIHERAGSPASGVLAEVDTALQEDPRWHVFYRSSKRLEFVPKTWLDWLPPFGYSEDSRYWVIVIFRLKERNIEYNVQVYTMVDAAKRTEIVTKLREGSSGFGFKPGKARKVAEQNARITAVESFLEWGEDDKPNSEKTHAAVKKTLDELYPKLEKLASVLKPLCKLPVSAT